MRYFKRLVLAGLLVIPAVAQAQSVFVLTTQNTSQNNLVVTGNHTLNGFHTTGVFPNGAIVLVWDATAVPATGALTNIPKGCFAVSATASPNLDNTMGMGNVPVSVPVATGLVVALSAATGSLSDCFTYTPVSGYISMIYQ